MNQTEWIRVRRDSPCPICEKPDWCLVADDESAAICARIESEKLAGQAGWVHRLRDDRLPVQWIPVAKPKTKPAINLDGLHDCCRRSLRPESRGWLSNELGISIDALEAFQVGFHPDKNVFSFPMRRPDGTISGIRYRTSSGSKFSETGGREGLFFVPGAISQNLIIVEGPTDTMAITDLGFESVIGRANCRGNVDQIVTLLRRRRPGIVIVIPDNDEPGLNGALDLESKLMAIKPIRILRLPAGTNDVRSCIQDTKKADWLRDRIGKELTQKRG